MSALEAAAASAFPTAPILTYFNADAMGFGGRGGAVRFFFLANGVKFEEDRIPMSDWSARKQELIKSGTNPAGTIPIVAVGDQVLTESVAMLRRFARQLGLYGQDLDADYRADVVADVVTTMRADLIAAAFGDAAAKEAYTSAKQPRHLGLLNTLLVRFGGGAGGSAVARPAALDVPGATHADALLFGVLHDDVAVFGPGALEEHAALKSFFESFRAAYPAADSWARGVAAAKAAAA